MKQIEKGIMKIRLRQKDIKLLNSGNIIIYDRDYLPFKIELECVEIER